MLRYVMANKVMLWRTFWKTLKNVLEDTEERVVWKSERHQAVLHRVLRQYDRQRVT